jgi:signal transduction histidine kinase
MNLSEYVSESISLIEGQAGIKNISVVSSVNKECEVYGDRNMISTILRNLLTNAVKFTPINGSISVEASIMNDNVEISVTDSGVGISKAELEKLFLIENAVSHKGTENEKGTGLGLILCKDFVEKNGGKIWVESEIGKGSRFIFTLPRK